MTRFVPAYAERLMATAAAAALIPSGAKVAMGLGASQPPAILKAIADRAEAGEVDDLRLYYLLSTSIAGDTVLRYELLDRIHPYSLFHGAIERAVEALARDDGRPNPLQFLPIGPIQSPVLFVLDVPMLAYCLGGLLRLYRQRADVVLGV